MPQFDRQAFGQRLRLLRDYREMTQQQVADFLNVNRSTYSYYENGKTVTYWYCCYASFG